MTETFATRLRACRDKAGLTLGQAAVAIGVSKTYLWQLEQNPKGPSLTPSVSAVILFAIADAYGVGVNWLWKGWAVTEREATYRELEHALKTIARIETVIKESREPV